MSHQCKPNMFYECSVAWALFRIQKCDQGECLPIPCLLMSLYIQSLAVGVFCGLITCFVPFSGWNLSLCFVSFHSYCIFIQISMSVGEEECTLFSDWWDQKADLISMDQSHTHYFTKRHCKSGLLLSLAANRYAIPFPLLQILSFRMLIKVKARLLLIWYILLMWLSSGSLYLNLFHTL